MATKNKNTVQSRAATKARNQNKKNAEAIVSSTLQSIQNSASSIGSSTKNSKKEAEKNSNKTNTNTKQASASVASKKTTVKATSYQKKNTYYSDGWYWITDKNGNKKKVSRWDLENSKGTNADYATSDSVKTRKTLSTLYGNIPKTATSGVVASKQTTLNGNTTVKLTVGTKSGTKTTPKYNVWILDSTAEYDTKKAQAAADKKSSNVTNIIVKDTEAKGTIGSWLDTSKLTKKQVTGLIKGTITPSLKISADGKTVTVTDKNGKKQTIKFENSVKNTTIAGVGDLSKLYTKGFTSKQIIALKKAAASSGNSKVSAAQAVAMTNLKTNIEKNKTVETGVHATTNSSSNLYGLKAVEQDLKTASKYGLYTSKAAVDAATKQQHEASAFNIDGSDTTYDVDGVLNIGPSSYVKDENGEFKTKVDKKTGKPRKIVAAWQTEERLKHSKPLSDDLLEVPDRPWRNINTTVYTDLYEEGAGKSREKLIHSLGLYEGGAYDYLKLSATKYNRFKLPTPDSQLQRTFAHVFFVKPQCNIMLDDSTGQSMTGQFENNPDYMYAASNSPYIIKELSKSANNQDTQFSFILSNAAKSFSLSDEYINTDTYGTGYTGYKVSYGKHGVESRTASDFTVTFQDDRNLSIYRLLKLWVDYIEGVYTGTYYPTDTTIVNHMLDYVGAVYYILTAEDGETILFWSKYYGVYPSSIPSTQYSWSAGTLLSQISLDVKFNYSWKEDYNINAITEFNYNSSLGNFATSKQVKYLPVYNEEFGTAGQTWVGRPFIQTVYEGGSGYKNGRIKFLLRFNDSDS